MQQTLRRWLTHPAFLFIVAWTVLVAILFAPLWTGGVIMNPMSDGKDGYVTRHFAAEMIRQWGEVPRWNSYIFGGMPFLGAMHGDQVYPISIALRAMFSPALGIGLGMVLHLWAGAIGMLFFLRKQPMSWTAAMVGATAYGLGGPFLSLFFPGHDGKIYVLGMLPWAMTAILLASRTLKPVYFAAWGTLIGLMLLSPHFQMTYYASLLMGAFVLLCVFTEIATTRRRLWMIGGMTLASVFGLMLAAAQLMPFVEYLPLSPRSASGSSSSGWLYATSWAMPGVELFGTMWGGFNGWLETYWGTNAFKLHSDYLGLLTGALALTALIYTEKGPRRRVVWFFAGAVIFGTLWVLGAQTPFYQLPYNLLPGIAKTRAPSMMWGHVSMCVAVLAAYGISALETMTAERRRVWGRRTGVIVAGGAALMVLSSGSLIPSLAVFERQNAAFAALSGARLGLVLGAITVVVVAVVAQRSPRWLGLAAAAMLVVDLGYQGRRFIQIDERGAEVFAADGVVQAVQADAAGTTQPWRLLPLGLDARRPAGPYTDDYLMEHRVRSTFGYHGNELHNYDELLGGKNVWTQRVNPRIWDLAAVRYIVTEQPLENSGLIPVASDVRTWLGEPAWVWRVPDPAPWARVVPLAIKFGDDSVTRQIVTGAAEFNASALALVPADAAFGDSVPPRVLPRPLVVQPTIAVEERAPGTFVLTIDRLQQDGILTVSENWVPSWTATVDGKPAPVARANGTFLAIPVSAGAREVILDLASPADHRGRRTSLLGLAGLVVFALSGLAIRPRAGASAA